VTALLLTIAAIGQNLSGLYDRLDEVRAAAGKPPLVVDARLEAAAKEHALWCRSVQSIYLPRDEHPILLAAHQGYFASHAHWILALHPGRAEVAINYLAKNDTDLLIMRLDWQHVGAASVAFGGGNRVTVLFFGVEE
jgi:hypothetical protein